MSLQRAAALAGAVTEVNTRPPDAFTIAEYMEYAGIGETTARKRLHALEAKGLLTAVTFRERGRSYRGWILKSPGGAGRKKTLAIRNPAGAGGSEREDSPNV